MRRPLPLVLTLFVAAGCSSDPPPRETPRQQPAATASRTPSTAESGSEGIVIKGSKSSSSSAPTGNSEEAQRRQERIDALNKQARAEHSGARGGARPDTFTSEWGGYSVSFPGEPEQSFVAKCTRFPEGTKLSKEDILFTSRRSIIKSFDGGTNMVRTAKLGEHDGLDLYVLCPRELTVRARIFYVKNRLYEIMAVSRSPGAPPPEITRFLDSFTLTK